MALEQVHVYGTVSEEDLQRFEANIGHPLPEDYRRFLATCNGMDPMEPVLVGGEDGDVLEEPLWGIHPEKPIIDLVIRNMWIAHSVTKDYLAITSCIGGFFLLALAGRRRGKIFSLSELAMGFEPPEDSPYEAAGEDYCAEKLLPEADSFTEFVDSLIPDPDND